MKKLFAKVCVLSVFCVFNVANFTNALTIAVDPGHGATAKGACVDYKRSEISEDNLSLFSRVCEFLKDYFLKNEICEKDINLKIAKYLKVLLENYFEDAEGNPVKVILTRSDDASNPTLEERVDVAKNSGAVALISLHNNATRNHDKHGAVILVTSQKKYLPDGATLKNIYEIEDGLSECFLAELNKLGIETYTGYFTDSTKTLIIPVENGRLRRLSEDNTHCIPTASLLIIMA